jgi:RNA polymerase sigma factor (TIGR02999 family)
MPAMPERAHVTEILIQATAGAPGAADQLFALVYDELRRLAGSQLRLERPDHTLQATELVHEAYMRLVDQTRCEWKNRAQFLAVAGQAMRRILVDHARSRGRQRRGGGWQKLPLNDALALGSEEADTVILSLEEALERFQAEDPLRTQVVEMLFFAGLTHAECAQVLGISPRTVARHWDYAQAWLYMRMTGDPDGERLGA